MKNSTAPNTTATPTTSEITGLDLTPDLRAAANITTAASSQSHSFVINELHLRRFKKFDQLDLSFDSGLNVIIGQNEQGKSTIVDALIAGLFYSPESRASYITAHKSWNARTMYAIDMELGINGVPFTLKKDFEDKYFLLRSHDGKTSFDTVEKGQAFLEEAMGISSADVFEATGCVRQDMITEMTADKKAIDSSLERSLTSAQVRVAASDVMKKIERKVGELKKGLKTRVATPGPLRDAIDQRTFKESRLQEMKQELDKMHTRRAQLIDFEREYVQITQELNAKQQLFEKAATRLQAGTAIVQLKKEYDRIQKELDTQEKLSREAEYLDERFAPFKSFSTNALNHASHELAKIQGQLEATHARYADEVPSVPSENTLRTRLFFAAGIAGAIGFLGFFVNPMFYAGFVIAAALAAYALFTKNKEQATRQSIAENKQREINEHNTRLAQTLAQFNCQSIDQFEQKKQEFETLLQKKQAIDSQLKLVASKADITTLEQEKRELRMNIEQQQQKIATALQSDVSEESVMQLESDIEQLQKRAEKLKQQITAHDAVIKNSEIDPEQVVLLEEEVVQLTEREQELEMKLQVLEVAHAALSQARETTLAQSSHNLVKFIEQYLPLITNNRYTQIELKPNLEVSVFSTEKNEFLAPQDALSQGTIEQIYLVARLALYRMLTGGKSGLMIFDDPFVNFDAERRDAAMRLLQQFAETSQILFLTHAETYAEYGRVHRV